MGIDLSKLWPADEPFEAYLSRNSLKHSGLVESFKAVDLGRKALDVMMRRRMYTLPDADGNWIVLGNPQAVDEYDFDDLLAGQDWFRNACPFTALVAADAWLTEREKANA